MSEANTPAIPEAVPRAASQPSIATMPPLEHVDGRVVEPTVLKAFILAFEARFGLLGIVIDESGRQIDRLARLLKGGAPCAGLNSRVASSIRMVFAGGFAIALSSSNRQARNKNPGARAGDHSGPTF